MPATAFTAGNRPGGLTNNDEIRLLVCFMISKHSDSLEPADLLEIVTACGAANYFECADAISFMQQNGHVTLSEKGFLLLSPTGEKIIGGLENQIPQSVRDLCLESCHDYLRYKLNVGQHKVSIMRGAEGGYLVKCVIADLGTPVFNLELYAPTLDSAQTIRQRFIEHGAKLYGDALKLLTQ